MFERLERPTWTGVGISFDRRLSSITANSFPLLYNHLLYGVMSWQSSRPQIEPGFPSVSDSSDSEPGVETWRQYGSLNTNRWPNFKAIYRVSCRTPRPGAVCANNGSLTRRDEYRTEGIGYNA